MTLIEHKVGNTLWSEIALKLYPDKLSCFREAIANALDENSEKIIIDITSDDIFIEDFGAGIDDMDKFIYVGHDAKLTREEENLIGQKGMGKLSLLALGEKVIFLSNNGEVGYKFDMSVKGHERDTPGKPTKFLNHPGTKIVIPFPKFIPNLEKVRTFLTKAFGLYLAQGKQIILNGKKLTPPKNLNPKPSFICKLSGDTSDIVDLAEGNVTPVDVVVTAEDGVTTSNFVVDINRDVLANFMQRVYVKPNVIDALDLFGASVAIEGDWLAIGVPGDQSRATMIDGDETDNTGTSVGSVSIYKRDTGGIWMRQAYLKASNADDNDRLGGAQALSGDTLLVGASGEQSTATGVGGDQTDNSGTSVGAAYVFIRDANDVWSQQAYLKASNAESNDEFGRYLALDGDTAVVGSWFEDSAGNEQDNSLVDSGAAYVFVRDAGVWSQQAYLKASAIDANDRFGENLEVDGDTLIVGAPLEDSSATGINGDDTNNSALDAGAIYVFDRSPQGLWSQSAYLKAANTDAGDFFGGNADLESDVLIVGALGEQSTATSIDGDDTDNSGAAVGAAYEFVRDMNGNWSQATYFKAANAQSDDAFGSAVTYEGNTLIVGARGENSLATGINGNAADNSGSSVGAAYVFLRASNDTWSQTAYVKASNSDSNDEFADAADFDGDTLVITAQGERSAATGTNGNEADDSLLSAGAGYVFR